MWKLNKIVAKNIGTFKDLEYNLNQDKTTLVFGENTDNDSQNSNGSGKSFLIEVIAIGLTGSPLRDVKNDEVINDSEDFAEVEIFLSNTVTKESLKVFRALSRKSPQQIKIEIADANGNMRDIPQASVNDYNKCVLDIIGLSKDDLYANFILSKHKYTSFLLSSDKEKKEIINRFSNGDMVDRSLELLTQDMEPIADELRQKDNEVSQCLGKIQAVDTQIAEEEEASLTRNAQKAARIADLKEKIAEERAKIRDEEESKQQSTQKLEEYDKAYNTLVDMEENKVSLTDSQNKINSLLKKNGLRELSTDYASKSKEIQETLDSLEKKSLELGLKLKEKNLELKSQTDVVNNLARQQAETNESCDKQKAQIKDKMLGLQTQIKEISDKIDESRNTLLSQQKEQSYLRGVLAGTITCPKCSHEFVLSEDIDVSKAKSQEAAIAKSIDELTALQEKRGQEITNLENEGKSLRIEFNELLDKEQSFSDKLSGATLTLNNCKTSVLQIQSDIKDIEAKTVAQNDKIARLDETMFNDAFDIVDDEIRRLEGIKDKANRNISLAEGNITAYQESIEKIENATEEDIIKSLKANKAKYEKEYNDVVLEKERVEGRLSSLKSQEAAFMKFKTHLANTKINALSDITNDFLEKIGSDIRIMFSGYTLLKSGKVRDKISISLIREGVECGSFGKLSEGEKSRVNLASILAMHKLTNINCEESKGLDLLVLDEILDAADESGLANIFEALSTLKTTALVVSHGKVAENYPHTLTIKKHNKISFINE